MTHISKLGLMFFIINVVGWYSIIEIEKPWYISVLVFLSTLLSGIMFLHDDKEKK